jgi:hypothetical protein
MYAVNNDRKVAPLLSLPNHCARPTLLLLQTLPTDAHGTHTAHTRHTHGTQNAQCAHTQHLRQAGEDELEALQVLFCHPLLTILF